MGWGVEILRGYHFLQITYHSLDISILADLPLHFANEFESGWARVGKGLQFLEKSYPTQLQKQANYKDAIATLKNFQSVQRNPINK